MSAVGVAHNGVMVVYSTGLIVVYNQAARTIAGFQPEQVLSHHISNWSAEARKGMVHILASGYPRIGRKDYLGDTTGGVKRLGTERSDRGPYNLNHYLVRLSEAVIPFHKEIE